MSPVWIQDSAMRVVAIDLAESSPEMCIRDRYELRFRVAPDESGDAPARLDLDRGAAHLRRAVEREPHLLGILVEKPELVVVGGVCVGLRHQEEGSSGWRGGPGGLCKLWGRRCNLWADVWWSDDV